MPVDGNEVVVPGAELLLAVEVTGLEGDGGVLQPILVYVDANGLVLAFAGQLQRSHEVEFTRAVVAGNAQIDGIQGLHSAFVPQGKNNGDAVGLVIGHGELVVEFQLLLGLA